MRAGWAYMSSTPKMSVTETPQVRALAAATTRGQLLSFAPYRHWPEHRKPRTRSQVPRETSQNRSALTEKRGVPWDN